MPMKLFVTTNGQFIATDGGIQILDARPATEAERQRLVQAMTRDHEAAKALGAPGHHVSASGIEIDGRITLKLSMDEEARATGERVLAEVAAALELPDDKARSRRLGRLVDICGDLVLRVPAVHAFMNRLYEQKHHSMIKGILGERRRGRPRANVLAQVALVGDLKRRKLWTKDCAAQQARRFQKTVAALENDQSRFRSLLELYGSRFVEADKLHDRPWRWPSLSKDA